MVNIDIGDTVPTPPAPVTAPPPKSPTGLTPEQKASLEQAGKILGWSLDKMEAIYNSIGAYADKIILHLDFVDKFIGIINDYGQAFTAIINSGGSPPETVAENVDKMIEAVLALRALPDELIKEAMKNAPEDPEERAAYEKEVNGWAEEVQGWITDVQDSARPLYGQPPPDMVLGYLLVIGLYPDFTGEEDTTRSWMVKNMIDVAKRYNNPDKSQADKDTFDRVQQLRSILNYANADASSTSQLLSSKLQKLQGDLAALPEKMSEATEKMYQNIVSMLRNVGVS